MQTDMLKTVLVHWIKATSELTDCMVQLLPEDTSQKVKLAGTSLLKMVHEISGDMLNNEPHSEEAKSKQTSITIE